MFAAKRAGQGVPCVVNDATQQTAPINLQPLVVTDVSALRHTENTLPTATLAGAWWALDHWYGCSRDYCLKCSIVDANFIFKHTPHRRIYDPEMRSCRTTPWDLNGNLNAQATRYLLVPQQD